MSLRKFMLLCVVLIIATGNLLVAGETVAHPQLGLRLTVPDGFVKDQTQVRGDVIHAFQRPPIGERTRWNLESSRDCELVQVRA